MVLKLNRTFVFISCLISKRNTWNYRSSIYNVFLFFFFIIHSSFSTSKSINYRQFGFMFDLLNPIHWFQFADDAAVITGQESENQHLLNRFSLWCQWSDMTIRVDKCSTFGIKKVLTRSAQYLPKTVNWQSSHP